MLVGDRLVPGYNLKLPGVHRRSACNAVLFSSTLILTSQFDVSDSSAPAYLIPWALANFAGALLLGRLFDTVGRRIMITARYAASAAGASCWARR
jgi:MFS family permease